MLLGHLIDELFFPETIILYDTSMLMLEMHTNTHTPRNQNVVNVPP